ncbi:MAG: hypothetical protein HY706_10280 [Candidatus Hydrogenedentes bacterium]|nr:hypothetical protein [Candidatus Hydrogenedentota bacterium]
MDVNLQLVREFFELNLFRVLTNWQQPGEHRAQLFVENSVPMAGPEREFVLRPADLSSLECAVVELRAWHADRFYPSLIEANPGFGDFTKEEALALAREVFGPRTLTTILVISEMPATADQRQRSVELLQALGVHHVLEFPTVLQDLLAKVSVNGVYAASQTLQTLRLLKRYRLVRHQQMELTFAADVGRLPSTGKVEAIATEEEES